MIEEEGREAEKLKSKYEYLWLTVKITYSPEKRNKSLLKLK